MDASNKSISITKQPLPLTNEIDRYPVLKHSENDERLGDLVGSFLDFFITLINNVLYKATSYSKDAFFLTDVFDIKVPICQHVKIAEYIEMCSKKLVALLSSNSLDGFQVNLMYQSIVIQRFVFIFNGKFSFDLSNDISVNMAQMQLATVTRSIIAQFDQQITTERLDSVNNKSYCIALSQDFSRFQIVFGLNEQAMGLYSRIINGPFIGDTDLCIFPWSKPRKKIPSTPQRPVTQRLPKWDIEEDSIPSAQPQLPDMAYKENSPSPTSSSNSSKKPRFSTPSPQTIDTNTKMDPFDALPEQRIRKQTYLSPNSKGNGKYEIHPVTNVSLGDSLQMDICVLSYTNQSHLNLRHKDKSGFSSNRIDSPGLYRGSSSKCTTKNYPRHLQYLQMKHQHVTSSTRNGSSLNESHNLGSPRLPVSKRMISSPNRSSITRISIPNPFSPVGSSHGQHRDTPNGYERSSKLNQSSSPIQTLRRESPITSPKTNMSPFSLYRASLQLNNRPKSARSLNDAFEKSASPPLAESRALLLPSNHLEMVRRQ